MVWVEKGQCNEHCIVKLLSSVSHSDLEPQLPVSCGISLTEHHGTTQDGLYFYGQNLGQEPPSGLSAFARMHPQLRDPFLFLALLSSHHAYEDSLEEVRRVSQSKCYSNSFKMQQPHLSQRLVKLLNLKGDN